MFFGLGIYGAAAALLLVASPNRWLAIAAGLAAAVAVCITYFATRLHDIYFAIMTPIYAQIFYAIIFTWTPLTEGENGLIFTRPHFAIPGLFSRPFTGRSLHGFVLAVVTGSFADAARHPIALWHGVAVDPRERGAHPCDRLSDRALQRLSRR